MSTKPEISVVIPTLNEADTLPATLPRLLSLPSVEVVVVDGGSSDQTSQVARRYQVCVLHEPGGRGRQMNAGARAARSDILLFLHADTLLPPDFLAHIRSVLSRPGVVAGAFLLQIEGDSLGLRLVEQLANWRSRFLRLPYGDQGLFLSRSTFFRIGGYADLPIMEDYELVRRLRRHGHVELAACAVTTSGRRWRSLGIIRTTVINQLMIVGFHIGIDPWRLARWYRLGQVTGKPFGSPSRVIPADP